MWLVYSFPRPDCLLPLIVQFKIWKAWARPNDKNTLLITGILDFGWAHVLLIFWPTQYIIWKYVELDIIQKNINSIMLHIIDCISKNTFCDCFIRSFANIWIPWLCWHVYEKIKLTYFVFFTFFIDHISLFYAFWIDRVELKIPKIYVICKFVKKLECFEIRNAWQFLKKLERFERRNAWRI